MKVGRDFTVQIHQVEITIQLICVCACIRCVCVQKSRFVRQGEETGNQVSLAMHYCLLYK